jgi:uncharacterized small protein (DUF1192 family)
MKKCYVCYALLILSVLGCSAKGSFAREAPAAVSNFSNYSSEQAESVAAYDDLAVWRGSGYNPEGPAGMEGQIPPASRSINAASQENGVQAATNGKAAQHLETGNSVQRKLVKRANLRIRVEDLAAAGTAIDALIKQHGAYTAAATINENYRNYTVRVPASAYDAFLAGMSGMGRTLNRTESAEDVTLRYYDLEGRLATKQELLKTFQSYLGKAKNIEEILSVEERIAGLQSDIDRTGNELRQLGDLTDYATFEIEIFVPVTAAPPSGTTLAERIRELFSGFGEFLSRVALALLGIIIYGIPLLLLAALLFWLLLGRVGLLKKLWFGIAGKGRPKEKDSGNGKKAP